MAVHLSHCGLGGTGFAVVRISHHRAISFGLGGVLYACIQLSQAAKNQAETVSWGVVFVYTFSAGIGKALQQDTDSGKDVNRPSRRKRSAGRESEARARNQRSWCPPWQKLAALCRIKFDDGPADHFGDLGHDGVSEASQSVHPIGNPMSHSTH
jgi:hypothetical protein